jgi:TatD DNase family protein
MSVIWFDSHCHLQDERYAGDLEEVLARAKAQGVEDILLAASNVEDAGVACKLALRYGLYCSAGVHPHDAKSWNDKSGAELKMLIAEANGEAKSQGRDRVVVAIGEIGLDYHYDFSPRDVQRSVFRKQLELAHETGLPLIFHMRESFADFYDILKQAEADGILLKQDAGVMHCYSGSKESAKLLSSFNLLFGFDGPLTFKNAKKPVEVVESLPLELLLLETDAPYLTPVPHRGKRNEPSYLPLIGQVMAEVKGVSAETIAEVTRSNARRLFRLEDNSD